MVSFSLPHLREHAHSHQPPGFSSSFHPGLLLLLPSSRAAALVLLSLLVGSALLGARHKSDLIVWYTNTTTECNSWPSSQSFWLKFSPEPRRINQCPFSTCPQTVAQQNITSVDPSNPQSIPSCPFFFRWIYEDLAPWKKSGISQELLRTARNLAYFRIVIKSGRLYVDPYRTCFQTRAIFTVWGILQLLKQHPGLVPDVDLLFGCEDRPVVKKKDYGDRLPPPVFGYCSTSASFDIPFPDWSFWGWPEIRLGIWDGELCGILKGANEKLWEERHPTAFWKGNPKTGGALRKELLKCNGSGAQIFAQDWSSEITSNFSTSKLAEQCRHRYKIYVEGRGWSVSLKYILACNSPVLLVRPLYYDFFSRGLLAKVHYWPVRPRQLCKSLQFAVNWGNKHPLEAGAMGRAGQQFITKEVSMGHVYDYMLHLLRGYAELLDFSVSAENLTEICTDALLCMATPSEKPFFEDSLVKDPSHSPPCSLPPYDQRSIKSFVQQQQKFTKFVYELEDQALSGD